MITKLNWPEIKIVSRLLPNEVHIYCTELNATADQTEKYFALLKPDEKERADRFHFQHDRTHYITARSQLRKILAQYINIQPEKLTFTYNDYGKPHLADHSALEFNLSHSNGIALYAIILHRPIGIDIEHLNRECDIDGITQRFFSPNEYQTLQKLSGQEKRLAFFNGWVRKEAFLKAIGQGLSYSLANVEVTLLPQHTAAITALHDPVQAKKNWVLHALDPAENYVAALAVEGNVSSIQKFVWKK